SFEAYDAKDTLVSLMDLPASTQWVVLDTEVLGSTDTLSYGCPTTVTLVKKMPLHTSSKRGIALATIPSCSLAAMMDIPLAASELVVIDDAQRIVLHQDASKVGLTLDEADFISDSDLGRFAGSSGQFE